MNREGLGIVLGAALFAAILVVGALTSPFGYLKIVAIVGVILTVFVIYFFRDPERTIPNDSAFVLSPADGKIVEIRDETDHEFMKSEATRISIFLNIFNVHVNRVPIAGQVRFFRYQKGAFVNAYKSEASDVNEQTVIGIENDGRKLLFKQIAGLIARRIVCNLREGSKVSSGERFGIIKFGSRVDVFLPKNVDIKVEVNQKVKGGESILGVFTDEVQ